MRSDWLNLGLLAGLLVVGTGAAPTEGVRKAEEWQHEADVARAGGQWDIAYPRYMKMMEVFPETPHSEVGAKGAQEMRSAALKPNEAPDSQSHRAWLDEIVDFFTWP